MDEERRVWLVERTYSDDEQNLIILTYATPDGRYEYRKERALTSFSGPARATSVSVVAVSLKKATVSDSEAHERYAAEAARMADKHDTDDTL